MPNFNPDRTYALFSTPANKRAIAELRSLGIEPALFPPVETEAHDAPGADEILLSLSNFEWLVVPDVFAAEYFLAALERLGIDFFDLDAVRVVAVGEAVADRLRFAQVHADIITDSVKPSDVERAIIVYLLDQAALENLKILLLKNFEKTSELAEILRQNGACVTELAVYRMKTCGSEATAKMKALLKGGAVDEFVFSSPLDVLALASIFPAEPLAELLEDIVLNADDEPTRQALKEFRLV